MAGMARQIRERLDVPVVCSLAGEDVFFDQLPPKYYTLVRDELRRRAGDITRFVAFNQYYAGAMAEYLDIALDRISIVPQGLSLTGHGSRATRHDDEFCIGYLARICPEKGLHHLVEAFRLLAGDPALPRLKLKIAGYLGAGDRRYWQSLQRRLHEAGLDSRVEYCGEVTRAQKIAFLQSLDVMSVPADYRESKGLSILEALANAVPVVLPEHGTYPELVGDTGGGLLFDN
jgi:glycosyltransferase involved in cell wall biosynthesis